MFSHFNMGRKILDRKNSTYNLWVDSFQPSVEYRRKPSVISDLYCLDTMIYKIFRGMISGDDFYTVRTRYPAIFFPFDLSCTLTKARFMFIRHLHVIIYHQSIPEKFNQFIMLSVWRIL